MKIEKSEMENQIILLIALSLKVEKLKKKSVAVEIDFPCIYTI